MGQRSTKGVLFLGTGSCQASRCAEMVFNHVAGKMGLPWKASARSLAPEGSVSPAGSMAASAVQALAALGVRAAEGLARPLAPLVVEDLNGAAWIVALNEEQDRPLLAERFPDHAGTVEYWQVADPVEALPLIEREVMDLVARLMGGGKRREPRPVPDALEAADPACQPKAEVSKTRGAVRVGRETKGRRGKGVTTVFDLPLKEAEILALAARLKERCGTGGTVKDGRIEIQGDLRERVSVELEKMGYKVKRTGG